MKLKKATLNDECNQVVNLSVKNVIEEGADPVIAIATRVKLKTKEESLACVKVSEKE